MAEGDVSVTGDALLKMLDGLGTRMDTGLARIETKLDAKADKVDLARIEARLDEHGKEIGRLKDQQRTDEAAARAVTTQRDQRASSSQRRWNLMLSTALVLVSLLGVLAAVFHW